MDSENRATFVKQPYITMAGAATAALVRRLLFVGAHGPRLAGKGGGVTMPGYAVAILWRGDHQQRRDATPHNNRYRQVFEELIGLGIDAQPEVYNDDIAEEVRARLLKADGVLVWVDPIHQGLTRERLDAMLRDVAARGPWVSAHPDVILKMGVKEVLYRTKHLGGARTLISTNQWRNSLPRSREGFESSGRSSSSRTAEMAVKAFGKLN